MHAVIFAGGAVQPGEAVTAAIASADLVIAADSGAAAALHYGCTPTIIVGDFDSLDAPRLQELKTRGSRIVQAAVEKNETDTELAVQVAIEEGASAITLLGGLGGQRFDHSMANILLLAGFEVVPLRIVDGPAICWPLRGQGQVVINGQAGGLLSLLPLTGDATGVLHTGLSYALSRESRHSGRLRGAR